MPSEALVRSHQVYDAALAARKPGRTNPDRQAGGWGASGARDEWEPDRRAAKASCWSDPFSWASTSSYVP